MNTELAQNTVGNLVAERPSRSRILERWGIDYCCGGKKTLEESCAKLSLSLDDVVTELEAEALEPQDDQTNWTAAPLSILVEHIVNTHHAYLREALPRLSYLTEKVRDVHGGHHPELVEIAQIFQEFRADMEAHTQKEELVLFPYIEKLAFADELPEFHCGSVLGPIRVMELEHEGAGAALDAMRRLSNDYAVPEGACGTYRAMLDALADLEADTHKHVHKENSILFPRAVAREADLKKQRSAKATKQ